MSKHPDIEVELSGHDGNAFFIIGRVSRALKDHGVPESEVEEFREQAMSGDYDNLLWTVADWVSVC